MTACIYDYPGLANEVRERLAAVKRIAAARVKSAAAKELEDPTRDGWSWKSLDRMWRRWEAAGRDEAALLDHRRHRDLRRTTAPTMPREFLEWVGGRMLGNQRKSRPAWRAVIAQWQDWRRTGDPGKRIPGYDAPPPPGPGGKLPDGWSYQNLMKCAQPPKEELAMARIGTVAAQEHLPFIPGTREGIRFLEYVFFDDVVHDREVCVPGYVDPVRVLQLGGLDYASGVYLKFGIRPDLPRDDGTRQRLKRRDFLFLVGSMLLEYGIPADYPMHLVVERATATLSLAEARYLYDISGGRIRTGYTSMEGRFVLAWEEAKSGNPRGKGPLESWHNLFHNEMAGAPGQVGKDRDHSPAALLGSDREAVALNKAALLLTPAQRREMRLPYPELTEAHMETTEVVRRINRRTDHRLEGFHKVLQWRIADVAMDWQPEAALANLDPALRDRVQYTTRVETPIERMQNLSAGASIAGLHPGALVRFYEDSHTAAKIERRQAKVRIEGRTYWFGPERAEDAPANGQAVELHHAPLEPSYALVTGGGKFLGVWQRQLVRRGDADALANGIRRKQSFLNHTMSSVRGKMLDKLVEQDRRLNQNLEQLEKAGVLPTEADYQLAHKEQRLGNDVAEAMHRATEVLRTEPARRESVLPDEDFSQHDTNNPTNDDGPDAGELADAINDML